MRKDRQSIVAALKQQNGTQAHRLIVELLDVFIGDGKDKLVTASPSEVQAVQGGVKALQTIRKALTSQSTSNL